MVSLPELRVVISSTAAVGSWVCQGPPSPSYLSASLVPSGSSPTSPEGAGPEESHSSLWSPTPERSMAQPLSPDSHRRRVSHRVSR